MKCVIVYWSRFGNVKRVCNHLVGKLKDNDIQTQIFKTDEADPTAMPEADLYLFSAPTEAFNIQKNMRKFVKKLEGMEEKKYGLINTHGMDKNWLPKMDKLFSKKNMVKVAEVEFRVGKNADTGNALMEGWETKLEEFAGKL